MPKYQAFPPIPLKDRRWPDNVIDSAPIWCSVDLRDGNQALINPMSVEQKLAMFEALVSLGFKQIEIGFPSASQIEYDFCRRLIEEDRIPGDVLIQVLCQAREHLVEKTFQAIEGAKQAVFHLYNSTSPAQRKYTFGMSKDEVKALAVDGIRLVDKHRHLAPGTKIVLEYSPESFSQTELEFSLEVCEAVQSAWAKVDDGPIILNLPATVEVCTPNQHADQIEWISRNIKNRDKIILSLHTHNDRGTGVAAAELALMAGAQRVEGTLFGNGERTGNLDLVTMALNMESQGVKTGLDFSDLPGVVAMYEEMTGMTVHPRHPYAGELVFTAFSGSHQDAIKKALEARKNEVARLSTAGKIKSEAEVLWDVPYLAIDPADVGRSYEAIIRINSQSGKGGVAWILNEHFGLELPKAMHPEVGALINDEADRTGKELAPEAIWSVFKTSYLEPAGPFALKSFKGESLKTKDGLTQCEAEIGIDGATYTLKGEGEGPIEAFVKGLHSFGFAAFQVSDFHEHALSKGADSQAAAYIKLRETAALPGEFRLSDSSVFRFERRPTSGKAAYGKELWGFGVDKSITLAGIKALLSALNRMWLVKKLEAPALKR